MRSWRGERRDKLNGTKNKPGGIKKHRPLHKLRRNKRSYGKTLSVDKAYLILKQSLRRAVRSVSD